MTSRERDVMTGDDEEDGGGDGGAVLNAGAQCEDVEEVRGCRARCGRYVPNRAELRSEVVLSAQMAWPTMLTSVMQIGNSLISLAFVGRLGTTELSGTALAIMVINIAWSGAVGVLCAIDTLASQAYGAGNTFKVGIIMQRGGWIVSLYAVPVAVMFCTCGWFLPYFGQTAAVSALAGKYARIVATCLLPAYWNEALRRSLLATGIVVPSLIVGAINLGCTALCNYLLIRVFKLGFIGAPISLAISYGIQLPLLVLVVWISKLHRKIWGGWSRLAFHEWWPFLKLALPGFVMVVAEWSAWEICALFAGTISETALAAYTLNYTTLSLLFMVPLAGSFIGSSRVGQNLGSGKPHLARFVAWSVILLVLGCNIFALTAFFIVRYQWGKVFTNEKEVIAEIGRTLPFALAMEFFDGIQGVSSGVLRGAGLQLFGGVTNIICFYVIGAPFAAGLVFGVKKDLNMIYYGFIGGVAVQTTAFIIRILTINWKKLSDTVVARERAPIAPSPSPLLPSAESSTMVVTTVPSTASSPLPQPEVDITEQVGVPLEEIALVPPRTS
jgi:MATE family multidrug resistance protein